MRSKPSTSGKILKAYPKNTLLAIVEKTNASWYKLIAPDGLSGYMSTTYLVYDSTEATPAGSSTVVDKLQTREQLFRVYKVTTNLNEVTVNSRHIFYDLLDNLIESYKPSNIAGATVAAGIFSGTSFEHPFTIYSDITKQATGRRNPVAILDKRVLSMNC